MTALYGFHLSFRGLYRGVSRNVLSVHKHSDSTWKLNAAKNKKKSNCRDDMQWGWGGVVKGLWMDDGAFCLVGPSRW